MKNISKQVRKQNCIGLYTQKLNKHYYYNAYFRKNKQTYVLQKGLRIKVYNLILYILFMKICENQ